MAGKEKGGAKRNETVERLIPIHPLIWDRLGSDKLATGISRRKLVQQLLCEHFDLDAGEYVVDGDNDPRLLAWRKQNGDQKRA